MRGMTPAHRPPPAMACFSVRGLCGAEEDNVAYKSPFTALQPGQLGAVGNNNSEDIGKIIAHTHTAINLRERSMT